MGLNLITNLAKSFFPSMAPQQPAAIDRTGIGGTIPASIETALKQVNTSIGEANPQGGADALSRQAVQELSTAESIATAPLVATTAPAELSAPTATAALATTNPAETTPAAIELRISQTAVESFKPILSALKSLVQSILPELNLQELAATAKPVLRTLLSPATSNPANTQATAATPA
jgi:hypothetical protein